MRSGWPHTQADHGRRPADERRGPFGPDISWPTGYSDLEYREGDYRYSTPATPPAPQPPAAQGEHPYAAFSAAGYGDDGYRDPGYDGPAAQDAGYRQPGYPPAAPSGNGYGHSGQPGQAGHPGYGASGYGPGGEIELAYPAPAQHERQGYRGPESYQGDSYRTASWDYDQPLRYDGEDQAYPAQDSYGQRDDYQQDDYRNSDGYGSGGYQPAPVYDPTDYNGSSYSRPGIDGPGYDLSGIIGTGDFEAFGYDEPSYGRLSYDDPRYDDNPRGGGSAYDYDAPRGGGSGYGAPHRDVADSGPRFDETRLDLAGFGRAGYEAPRFDETRLDSLWLADDDVRDDAPVGYENDGFGDSRVAPRYPDFGAPNSGRFDETRLDLGADMRMDQTRFDVPAYDETRMDMRALDARPAATGLLAPPEDQPLSWAEEISFDDFDDFDDAPMAPPAAFVRTAEREDDTATRRAIGRRRGRSGDRRQWMALGAIAVVAAGTIGGVLMKYVFSGPSGPAHTVVAPAQADGFTRNATLEKQLKVDSLAQTFLKDSSGHMSDLVPAVYEQGSAVSGASPQIFEFVGGKLSGASPAASVASFTHDYPGAQVVPAGSLGGEAVCAEAQLNGQSMSVCAWFDNDSFGVLMSPTMSTAKLATTLDAARPSFELYATK